MDTDNDYNNEDRESLKREPESLDGESKIQRTDQNGLELWRKKLRTMCVQCSVDICIIWLCTVFICVSHIIAFCFFCYGSLSIYNSASFIFVFFALLALLFFLSQFVFNAFVYILKLRSTSLILPTLILFLIQLFLDISILAITIDFFSNKGRDIVFVNMYS